MNEIALVESLSLRNEFCKEENLVVLDKVGQLITLSETDYALTDGVADFYESPLKTLRTIVRRHKEELEMDGYNILSIKEFREFHNETLKSKARKIAIFPRRAVLRIGMLLRDSEVAKRVRTYLLDAERTGRPRVPQEQKGPGSMRDLLETLIKEIQRFQLYQATMFAEVFESQAEILGKLEGIEARLGKPGGESYTR